MIDRFFKMAGEIHRKVNTKDDMGGRITSWLAIMTSKGVLDLMSGSEVYRASKLMSEATHIWMCSVPVLLIEDPVEQTTYFGTPFAPSPFGEGIPAEILNTDRLIVGGSTYEIVYVDDPMNMGHHLEIAVKRLESGQI